MLNQIAVSGEVSNLKDHYSSGHLYFSLKDGTGTIPCVMFAGSRRGLAFPIREGDEVIVTGRIDVYERAGSYQLYAAEITKEGAGVLYERFLALKAELEEMGMFDASYKQELPWYAKKIGVVTAPTGAVVQDIRTVALRRNPFVSLLLFPAKVQGAGAAESVVRGIKTLDTLGLDVIIVGRGGGSIEDLSAFNEESVARAIFDAATPIISAVGHETDTTIADFVADRRAPTPSAAAELATVDVRELLGQLASYGRRMRLRMEQLLDAARLGLNTRRKNWSYLSPQHLIQEKRHQLAEYEQRLQGGMWRILTDKKHALAVYIQTFKGLSPLDKLGQGFSYVEDARGGAVSRIAQVAPEDILNIQVTDGTIHAQVRGTTRVSRTG